ncbi:USP36_42 [Acanthosepion pharaonis]|uniref:Ubiquitin carboxyl-terminal hydrolase 36 n=1 Tax=Acanthosepion pharaonis TaxID=158019 RepID=A0A812C6P3_ACAPH|nr:USP36_42 [Sepia pharaonis]
MQKIGAGLHNLGNTCFLNATLQCLSYTPPLVNHLLSDEHTDSCKQVGFCMMCELQVHIRRCYENSGHAIKPQSILQKLKVIAKHMHFGRQEDAHEFLRYVVDALQKSCLNGYLKQNYDGTIFFYLYLIYSFKTSFFYSFSIIFFCPEKSFIWSFFFLFLFLFCQI